MAGDGGQYGMARTKLRDDQWGRIENLVPGKEGDRGRSGENNRLFVEAVLWVIRIGAPWRESPREFGNWNSAFQRYNRWGKTGVWKQLFAALSDDPDFEYAA